MLEAWSGQGPHWCPLRRFGQLPLNYRDLTEYSKGEEQEDFKFQSIQEWREKKGLLQEDRGSVQAKGWWRYKIELTNSGIWIEILQLVDGDFWTSKALMTIFSGWLLDSAMCYVFWHLKHWVVILFQNENEFICFNCVLYWVLINFKDFSLPLGGRSKLYICKK